MFFISVPQALIHQLKFYLESHLSLVVIVDDTITPVGKQVIQIYLKCYQMKTPLKTITIKKIRQEG
jgi:hypothetical protein